MSLHSFDLAVIGGGPAGIAAALQAASAGIKVALIDDGDLLGGHFYKLPPTTINFRLSSLQKKKQAEIDMLIAALERTQIELFQGVQVWGIFNHEGKTINGMVSENETFRIAIHPAVNPWGVIEARSIILAPGVYDRPIPFPGWELPGVVTPGAVQVQLEKQALLPGKKVLVAGSGPLQLIVAAELLGFGVDVVAVLDTSSFFEGWQTILGALGGLISRLSEGMQAGLTLMRHRVPILFRHAVFRAIGDLQNGVQGVVYGKIDANGKPLEHTTQQTEVDTICCAYGFSPAIALSLHIGCKHEFDHQLGTWKPYYDGRLQTSVNGVYVAGDVTMVGGKPLANLQGKWAAISVLEDLGVWSTEHGTGERAKLQPAINREEKFARWLWTRYRVLPGLFEIADEDTLICRCEGVRKADIQSGLEDDAMDLFGIKLRTRLGMGQCQGRYCFSNAAMMIALSCGKNPSNNEVPTIRPPIVPMRLQHLAAYRDLHLEPEEASCTPSVYS